MFLYPLGSRPSELTPDCYQSLDTDMCSVFRSQYESQSFLVRVWRNACDLMSRNCVWVQTSDGKINEIVSWELLFVPTLMACQVILSSGIKESLASPWRRWDFPVWGEDIIFSTAHVCEVTYTRIAICRHLSGMLAEYRLPCRENACDRVTLKHI